MPHFKFTFKVTTQRGGEVAAPTKAQLKPDEDALKTALGATALSLSFTVTGDREGVVTVRGTVDNLETLKGNVETTIDELPPLAGGWVAGGENAVFAEDGDPQGGRRRRRSSSKRVRKVTRRHRHRSLNSSSKRVRKGSQ